MARSSSFLLSLLLFSRACMSLSFQFLCPVQKYVIELSGEYLGLANTSFSKGVTWTNATRITLESILGFFCFGVACWCSYSSYSVSTQETGHYNVKTENLNIDCFSSQKFLFSEDNGQGLNERYLDYTSLSCPGPWLCSHSTKAKEERACSGGEAPQSSAREEPPLPQWVATTWG